MMSKKKIKINIRPKGDAKPPSNKPSDTPRNTPDQEKKRLLEEQRIARERDEKIRQERARIKAEQLAEKKQDQQQNQPQEQQADEKPSSEKKTEKAKKKPRSTYASRRKAAKAAKAKKSKAAAAQMSKIKQKVITVGFLLLAVLAVYWLWNIGDETGEVDDPITNVEDDKPVFKDPVTDVPSQFRKYGLDTRKYEVRTFVPVDDMPLLEVLSQNRIDRADIGKIRALAAKQLRPLVFKGRHKYTVFEDKETRKPTYMVYEANALSYIKFGLADSLFVQTIERKTETKTKTVSVTLANTLDETFYKKSIDNKLAYDLDEALGATVDLFRIKVGSEFKIYYEETFADGDRVDSKLIAAYIKDKSKRQEYYAFWYKNGSTEGYFDERARATKRSFLKSPLEFGRVTSKYGERTHPVTGIKKTHKGTDFAAPSGTPIRALADGVVSIATFKKNNGNYVKIKHSDIYDTQYLHMLQFAEGITPGATVRQGQVIGLVGSTGLSTGPHVCLRFWKNNKQVDFLNEDLPENSPISDATRAYPILKDSLKRVLDDLQAM